MDAITAIHQRISSRRYRAQPVPRDTIERLLECAVRAPNHKLTQPWRFVVLTGAARDQFAELRAQHRLKRFDNPASPEALAAGEKMRRESRDTPVFLVFLCAQNPDDITREEDYAATMMAVANVMIAAESLGLGTYLKTGGIMRDPAVRALVQAPEKFDIVAILSLGYPAETEPPRRRKPAAELTEWVE